MRLIILMIIIVMVGLSLSTTLIQNFLPGNKSATSTGSFFSFPKVYMPDQDSKNAIYRAPMINTQIIPDLTAPEPESKKEETVVAIDPIQLTFKEKIKISSVSGGSSNASDESLTISNTTSSEDIDITGFTIENSAGEKFLIPKGYDLPGYSPIPSNEIILSGGGKVTIRIGEQERQMNFRENLCTGYFNQSSNFNGALSKNCPKPEVSKMLNFNDQCISTLNSIPVCRTMDTTEEVNYECNQFANEHYSYVGCVNDFRGREDFYSNNWLIWMQKSTEFFRNLHDKIILKDQAGKIVDEYSY